MDSGNYVAGAIALESGDMNTAGFAMFKIKQKTDGVRMYWAQQAEAPMSAAEGCRLQPGRRAGSGRPGGAHR